LTAERYFSQCAIPVSVIPIPMALSGFEGPSDRVYINKWIQLFSDSKWLKEYQTIRPDNRPGCLRLEEFFTLVFSKSFEYLSNGNQFYTIERLWQ